MIRYKDLLTKQDIIDFAFSSSEPDVHDLNLFLRSKLGNDYIIIRKAIILELQEKARDRGLSENTLNELSYLDIK